MAATRRQALGQLGLGLGAGLLTGCGLGPMVCGSPPPESLPGTARDAHARALLANIDTFVVVMLENRSFDHLLGGLALDRDYPAHAKVLGLTGEEFNLDSAGRPVLVKKMPGDGRGTFNPGHDWRSVRATFNDGRIDRFVTVNEDRPEVMSYLARDQVPVFHALADRYTVFDHWYASYMGQTWPNRYYLHATTSGGRRENRPF
ncbi:MAG TPA: alkaline phosphatase family protein, partial [Polyangia bacterium]